MTKNVLRSALVIFCLLGVLFVAHLALADSQFGGSLTNPLACPQAGNAPADSLQACAVRVINFLTIIATPIVSIMVLYGGFLMITAAGEPEKFSQGRKTLLYAAIGFAVVLLANGVAGIIQNIFKP